MDKKLAEYRAKKQREEMINQAKLRVKKIFSFGGHKKKEAAVVAVNEEQEDLISDCDDDEIVSNFSDDDDNLNCCTYIDLFYYALYFILWATIYVIFIKLEFGTIYFIVSALVGIYFNTRTGKKKKKEVSAYSVFNKDCKSIDGTLKAEQLERQMIYGRLV